jgi:hypothetical protein
MSAGGLAAVPNSRRSYAADLREPALLRIRGLSVGEFKELRVALGDGKHATCEFLRNAAVDARAAAVNERA